MPTGTKLCGPPLQLASVVVVVPSKIEQVVAPVVDQERVEVDGLPPVTDAVNDTIVVSTHTFEPVHVHFSSTPLVHGQSVAAMAQPQAPNTQAVPVVSPVQTLQVFPFLPHSVGSLVPVTQVAPALQQPPLQSWVEEQLVVQR